MTKVSAYIWCPMGEASVMARSISDQLMAVTKLSAARGFNLGAIFVDVCNGSTRGCELTRQRKQVEIAQCEERVAEARKRLANLHDGIEVGTLSARDPDIAIRIKERRSEIDALNRTARMLRQQLERGPSRITPEAVDRFGRLIRDRLLSDDNPAKQQIARAFIRQVRVGPKTIEIDGETAALALGAAAVAKSKGKVPSFDRGWCRLRDSNT